MLQSGCRRSGGEVKAVHLVVASLMGFVYHLVQRVFSYFQFFSVEHGATKVDYLSLGIVAAYLFQKLLISRLQQFNVVVVGGEVVGAEVDAYQLGLVAAEVPLLAAIVEVGVLVFGSHHVLRCSCLGAAVAAIDSDATAGHHMSHCIQLATANLSIGQIVVLGFIFKRITGHDGFVTIAAGNAVADELNGALRQGGGGSSVQPLSRTKPRKSGFSS